MRDGKALNKIAKQMIKELKKHGITIQYYHAITSNSIYLKLDYGMAHSVRISDHHGNNKLRYRYNVSLNSNFKKVTRVPNKAGYRYYAPPDRIGELVKLIVRERYSRMKFLTKERYEKEMQITYLQNEGRNGFWSKYKYV